MNLFSFLIWSEQVPLLLTCYLHLGQQPLNIFLHAKFKETQITNDH